MVLDQTWKSGRNTPKANFIAYNKTTPAEPKKATKGLVKKHALLSQKLEDMRLEKELKETWELN